MRRQETERSGEPNRIDQRGKGLKMLGPAFQVDDSIRGIPIGTAPLEAQFVPDRGWSVSAGDLAYPVLTVSESAYRSNRNAIFNYAAAHGALLAPHIKTPMSIDIAHDLISAGAWGVSVANLQQASVMLRGGITQLLFANQLGGEKSGQQLGLLLAMYSDAECVLFVDSMESLAAANRAGEVARRPLPVLVEVGLGRAGLRTVEQAQAVIEKAMLYEHVELKGVASYEGAVASADPVATFEAIGRLNDLTAWVFSSVRQAMPGAHLLLSSGGSQYFDLVVQALSPLITSDGNTDLVLRSGAIFFHDHGVYARAVERMDERRGFALDDDNISAARLFQPAMRVWAEALSRPESDLVICGIGMRDVSFDQDFPVPLRAWRDGICIATLSYAAKIEKLNDQHGFLRVSEDMDIKVGDLVEFGISHPCTCFDRWRYFFVIDEEHRVTSIHQTFFG